VTVNSCVTLPGSVLQVNAIESTVSTPLQRIVSVVPSMIEVSTPSPMIDPLSPVRILRAVRARRDLDRAADRHSRDDRDGRSQKHDPYYLTASWKYDGRPGFVSRRISTIARRSASDSAAR